MIHAYTFKKLYMYIYMGAITSKFDSASNGTYRQCKPCEYNVETDVYSPRDWIFDTSAAGILADRISLKSRMPLMHDSPCLDSVVYAVTSVIAYDTDNLFIPNVTAIRRKMTQANTRNCLRMALKAMKLTSDYGDVTCQDTHTVFDVYESLQYYRLCKESTQQVKQCIAFGFPVMCLLKVYRDMTKVSSIGLISTPTNDELKLCLGNHAIVITGYNDHTQTLQFANSLGSCWGDRGYGYIQYTAVEKLLHGMWVVKSMLTEQLMQVHESL